MDAVAYSEARQWLTHFRLAAQIESRNVIGRRSGIGTVSGCWTVPVGTLVDDLNNPGATLRTLHSRWPIWVPEITACLGVSRRELKVTA